jgi:hypothetical protein
MERFREIKETGKEIIDKAKAKGDKAVVAAKKKLAQDAHANFVSKKDKMILDICKISPDQLGAAMEVVKAGNLCSVTIIGQNLVYLHCFPSMFIML